MAPDRSGKHFQDVSNTLQQDRHTMDHFRTKLDECVKDTIAATRIVEGFRNQQASGVYLKNYASFPLEYVFHVTFYRLEPIDRLRRFFTKVTNDLQERLEWYKNTLEASRSTDCRYYLTYEIANRT